MKNAKNLFALSLLLSIPSIGYSSHENTEEEQVMATNNVNTTEMNTPTIDITEDEIEVNETPDLFIIVEDAQEEEPGMIVPEILVIEEFVPLQDIVMATELTLEEELALEIQVNGADVMIRAIAEEQYARAIYDSLEFGTQFNVLKNAITSKKESIKLFADKLPGDKGKEFEQLNVKTLAQDQEKIEIYAKVLELKQAICESLSTNISMNARARIKSEMTQLLQQRIKDRAETVLARYRD